MKIIERHEDITAGFIYPHPDNPRKDLGDLSELVESIKQTGILQNLTVIEGGKGLPDPDAYGYTVIIGHRRLAAAKLAGLKEVPCTVVEMDEREQAATMLLENMQRSDLTPYEQAQGFQMMIDLGETKESISKKTGLSSTTVSHRLELLKLDPELLKEAETRQAKLTDYYELEKIKDPELKNRALKEIGTGNFSWAVKSSVTEEKRNESIVEAEEYLASRLKKIDYDEGIKRKIIKAFYFYSGGQAELDKVDELIEGKDEVFYTQDGQKNLYIVGELKEIKTTMDINAEWQRRQEEIEKRKSKIRPIEEQAAALRLDFVKKYAGRSTDIEHLLKFGIEYSIDTSEIEWDRLGEVLGIEFPEDEDGDTDEEAIVTAHAKYQVAARKCPQILMLAVLYVLMEDREYHVFDYQGYWQGNLILDEWYELLKKIGYVMSDAEQELLDGTHECFEKREDDE